MSEDAKPVAVGKITIPIVVAIGVVVTVGLTVGSWTWIVGSQFSGMRDQIQSVNFALGERLTEIKSRMDTQEARAADRWNTTDMRIWASELARKNRDLNIPEVGR